MMLPFTKGLLCVALSLVYNLVFFTQAHGWDKRHLELVQAGHIDLAGFDLSKANLKGFNFSDKNLAGANLQGAHLQRALFNHADLRGANLSNTYLTHVKFIQSNLDGACFKYAGVRKVSFMGCSARGVNFNQASFFQSNVCDTDFSGASFIKAYFKQTGFYGDDITLNITQFFQEAKIKDDPFFVAEADLLTRRSTHTMRTRDRITIVFDVDADIDLDIDIRDFPEVASENSSTAPEEADQDNVDDETSDDELRCCICYRFQNYGVLSPCNHSFCERCCVRFAVQEQRCPLCRNVVREYSPIEAEQASEDDDQQR